MHDCEIQLTLNSNGGKIVPKLEELKECFYHIDADGGGTLDKHEIFHALSVNWELIKFLRGSATLKPLLSLRNWKKAMINMKEPDKRHESSCKLVEMTADARNAKLVADIGALKLFVNLLRPENGAVAVNIAGALANMIWHCRELSRSSHPWETNLSPGADVPWKISRPMFTSLLERFASGFIFTVYQNSHRRHTVIPRH